MAPTKTANRLAQAHSPYLRQHQYNPVDWYPWGEEAFAKARQEMKLIFLSIGYAACHWCHVMEEESFENEEIARILNTHFVSIKVDREERPDVDAYYIEAVQQMTGHAGWPLSVFLLPDLRPVFGGTYFPPEDRYGRPGFKRILETLVEYWQRDPERLIRQAKGITANLFRTITPSSSPAEILSTELLEQATEHLSALFDPTYGGFGRAPKFPQVPNLELLLHEAHRTGEPYLYTMVDITLEKLASGGIYDQIGAGFHRYATDEAWLIPHFEKMLYDNALLARTYLHAYQVRGNSFFIRMAEEILDFMLREMKQPEEGFISSIDADSEGEEGAFYVWSVEKLKEQLSPAEWAFLQTHFYLPEGGNWEGKLIFAARQTPEETARDLGISSETFFEQWEALRNRLRTLRSQRPAPCKDDKQLTSWNAMAIEAFIDAYLVTRKSSYLAHAEQTASFILQNLRPRPGELLHAYREGVAYQEGFLEDYAYMSHALLRLFEATGDPSWLQETEPLLETMLERFYDTSSGQFFFTPAPTELPARPQIATDLPYPSAQAMALEALHKGHILLHRPEWQHIVHQTLSMLTEHLRRYPSAYAHHLQLLSRHLHTEQIVVIVGPEPEPFLQMLYRHYHPSRIVLQAKSLPEHPLVQGKALPEGQTGVFICQGHTCEPPITSLEALEQRLKRA